MTTNETLLAFVLAIAVVAILLRSWFVSRGRDQGANVASEVLSVWAVKGPFESGEQSAAAMHNAHIDVLGREGAKGFAATIAKHAVAFDNEPDEWERVRQEYLKISEQKEKEKGQDQLAINMATLINMHFLNVRRENQGDLPESFEHNKFIVGYILGFSGAAAHVSGAKSSEDSGHVIGEVLNRLFPGKGLALMNAVIGWKNSGDQVVKDAALLGMNEFVNAHKIMATGRATGDDDAFEKSMHELRGLEKYLTTL